MVGDGPWLNVPQAVVLEVRRDFELVLNLTAETTALLVIKANQLLARRLVIPLEEDADTEQREDALKKFHEAKTAMRPIAVTRRPSSGYTAGWLQG